MLTAIVTGGILIIGLLALYVAAYRKYLAEKRELLLTLKLYFEPQDAETPSQFALLTEVVSERLAQKLVHTMKASFMGMQSVDAKNAGRLESDLLQDVASQQNPALGAILGAYPAVARRLAKNPSLLPLVQSLMSKVGSQGSSQSAHHTDHGQDTFAIK